MWMFSRDSKEAFKNYTLCSVKANEQKSTYEENERVRQEARPHVEPVPALRRLIRVDWSALGPAALPFLQAASLQALRHLFLRN